MQSREQTFAWALSLGDQGRHAEAVKIHTQLLKRLTRDDSLAARAYFERGLSYLNLGQEEKAVADFRRTLEHDPNHFGPNSWLGLAGSRYDLGHERAFLYVIAGKRRDATPWLIYADWLEERGDPRRELIRLMTALSSETFPCTKVEPAIERLRELHASVSLDWLTTVNRLRSRGPLCIRLTNTYGQAHGPIDPYHGLVTDNPGYTIIQGILVWGTIRVGDEVSVPTEDGQWASDKVSAISDYSTNHCSVLRELREIEMQFTSDHLLGLNPRPSGLIRFSNGA
jgi:uncharacterized protein (TIGR02996 family)